MGTSLKPTVEVDEAYWPMLQSSVRQFLCTEIKLKQLNLYRYYIATTPIVVDMLDTLILCASYIVSIMFTTYYNNDMTLWFMDNCSTDWFTAVILF